MQKEPPSPTPFSPEDDRARENTLNATLSKFTDFSGRGKEGAGFSPRNQLRGFSPLGVRSFYPNPHTFNNLTRNIPRGVTQCTTSAVTSSPAVNAASHPHCKTRISATFHQSNRRRPDTS